ncbi:hypothetical protein [Mycobacterium paraterrae]|uniref:Aminoglycoside phosphotransferase domain-containing protein n=1 Tax=Mycobacterium paraterrae TaxID=577492 RepID=A0ABY3VHA3_9MYCO|nr:hypothetical protein [Mycobacterium paraterrae]UMB68790.1 hypothetical protein MKK62_20655 [Mycobacterium paraterrae]
MAESAAPKLNGQYILKVQTVASPDGSSYQAFLERHEGFANGHVPDLVFAHSSSGFRIEIYDVAGFSLDTVRTLENVSKFDDREVAAAIASAGLLAAQLDAQGEVTYDHDIKMTLRDWLGADFPDNPRGKRISLVRESIGVETDGSTFHFEGELLPDPVSILSLSTDNKIGILTGLSHGDLHPGNILVRGSFSQGAREYWIIDPNWSVPGPLLYDQAYLEVALLLNNLSACPDSRFTALLGAMDDQPTLVRSEVDLMGSVLVNLLKSIRRKNHEVLAEKEPKRGDLWRLQSKLARIAAGLNWAAKPLDDLALQQAAYVYAAWTTRQWAQRHEPDLWENLVSSARPIQTATIAADAEAIRLWDPFHKAGQSIDVYVIADKIDASHVLDSMSTVPWVSIIDLDPQSDLSGTQSTLLENLKIHRHTVVYGERAQRSLPTTSTNWLMANGWASRGEPSAKDHLEWRRRGYLARVRQLVDYVADHTTAADAAVLLLHSGRSSNSMQDVYDYIDERYGGVQYRLDLTVEQDRPGFDLDRFFASVGPSLAELSPAERTLPGASGPVRIDPADLYRLEVELEVLHSAVLQTEAASPPPTDEFWRGRPPTWGELDAGIDLPRDATPGLIRDLRNNLEHNRLIVVTLDHSPGAGGTTAARRAAWDLHYEYPTVLLRRYSPLTAERIDELHQALGRAVLVIADAADMEEWDFGALLAELQSRNSRAVILSLHRSNTRDSDSHHIFDPMSEKEKSLFIGEYAVRAVDPVAKKRLDDLRRRRIGEVPDQYFSPFYFGLCAFDNEFSGLDRYVHHHTVGLTKSQREIAEYLALMTQYGQGGIPADLIRRWLDADPPESGSLTDEYLSSLLGPDLRHLVVSSGGYLRLLHPLVANEVLEADKADGSRTSLAQVSVNFIRKVASYLGSGSRPATEMLFSLFIRREPNEQLSELVGQMSDPEGELVFEELTNLYPNEAHFWNHRGRFHIYRVKGDFSKAEEYLQRAVEESEGADTLHYHTLGMVRRFWIEYELTEALKNRTVSSPAELLSVLKPLFDSAMDAFAHARNDAARSYGWVSPIQMIHYVLGGLVQVAGADSLTALIESKSDVTLWIASQLEQAESLLEEIRATEGERRNGGYHRRLLDSLTLLYGNIDELLERWRSAKKEDPDSVALGLVLGRTLFASKGRDWSTVAEADCREIYQTMRPTIEEGRAKDADLRIWFQAYRRLPEYSEQDAKERLSWYSEHRDSLDASYYMYILQFLAWLRKDLTTQDSTRVYLDKCKRLSAGRRRDWSYEWYGVERRPHILVHHTELGRRKREPQGFWEKPDELERIDGIIDRIRGPQAGEIRVAGGQLTAFFVPGNKFLATRDINAAVDFFLGFSYSGLRAWEADYPGLPKAHRTGRITSSKQGRSVPLGGGMDRPLGGDGTSGAVVQDQGIGTGALDKSAGKVVVQQIAEQLPGGDPRRRIAVVISKAVDTARAGGQALQGVDVGNAIVSSLGSSEYKRFKSTTGSLRTAVESLGFSTADTEGGFSVDFPD